MTMTDSKSERWHTIEGKHLGQCIWQRKSENGKMLLEGIIHKATGRIMIVEKTFDERLPSMDDSRRKWPELIGIQVYAPIDGDNNTFEGLDQALANYK